MEDRLLGTLYRWGPAGQLVEAPLNIYRGDEIYIGRDISCQYQILNSHVSGRHIHLYTVTFDEENPDDLEPLVYARNLSRFGTKWNAYMMHEQGESFLLSHGDMLEVTPGIAFRFESANPTPPDLFSQQNNREMRLFSEEFAISPRCLGFGAYGRVHMAYRVRDGKQLACKMVDLALPTKQAAVDGRDDGLSEFGVKQLVALRQNVGGNAALDLKIEVCEREAKLLAGLKHPNIVAVEAAIRCDHTLYIFVELATGGDLYSFLKLKGGKVEPTTAAKITLQLLLAVQYIHARGIVHRDIKPDNILTTSQEDGGRVILTDFGCARVAPEPTKRLSTVVGTKEYCAPEVFSLRKEGYTAAVDIWSVGRVTGTMLVGYTPTVEVYLDPEAEEESGIQLLMSDLASLGLHGDPTDFLIQLLSPEPEKRPSATAALGHAWFANLPNKRDLEQRYQQSIRAWRSRACHNFGTDPITRLTIANPFATYCPNRRAQATSIPIAEEYTLFPVRDYVPESSYGDDAPSGPQRKPLTHMRSSSNGYNQNPAASNPATRGLHMMNQPSAAIHATPARVPQRDLQFLSQVERLHADPQLPKGKYLYIAPEELVPDQPVAGRYPHLGRRVHDALNPEPARPPTDAGFFYNNPGVSTGFPNLPPSYPFVPNAATEQRSARLETPDSQGQVYEEVRNPVTGKRGRIIYGQPEEKLREF